MAVLING